MAWPPEHFFLGQPGELEASPQRPIGQGDVFHEVPFPAKYVDKQEFFSSKKASVIVVASSCGMRKGPGGQLNKLIHAAPIKPKSSLAPHWDEPFDPDRSSTAFPCRA